MNRSIISISLFSCVLLASLSCRQRPSQLTETRADEASPNDHEQLIFMAAISKGMIQQGIKLPDLHPVQGAAEGYPFIAYPSLDLSLNFIDTTEKKDKGALKVELDVSVEAHVDVTRRNQVIINTNAHAERTLDITPYETKVSDGSVAVNTNAHITGGWLVRWFFNKTRRGGRISRRAEAEYAVNQSIASILDQTIDAEMQPVLQKTNEFLATQLGPMLRKDFPGRVSVVSGGNGHWLSVGVYGKVDENPVQPYPKISTDQAKTGSMGVRVHQNLLNDWLRINLAGKGFSDHWFNKVKTAPFLRKTAPILAKSLPKPLQENIGLGFEDIHFAFVDNHIEVSLTTSHALSLDAMTTIAQSMAPQELNLTAGAQDSRQLFDEVFVTSKKSALRAAVTTQFRYAIEKRDAQFQLVRQKFEMAKFNLQQRCDIQARMTGKEICAEDQQRYTNVGDTFWRTFSVVDLRPHLRQWINHEIRLILDHVFERETPIVSEKPLDVDQVSSQDGWLVIDFN